MAGPPPVRSGATGGTPFYKQRPYQVLAALLVVALGAGGYLLASGRLGSNEVLLEAKAAPGPDPFTPPLGPAPIGPPEVAVVPSSGQGAPAANGQPGGAGTGGTGTGGTTATRPPAGGGTATGNRPTQAPGTASAPAGSTARPPQAPGGPATPAAPPARPATAGGPVALVGGPEQASACDRNALALELNRRPGAATAWADVLRLKQADVPAYVGKLKAGFLQSDTRFTNYGFRNNKAQPRQSVLEAGTSVLLDPTGVPVVRCESGSPLLPPIAVSGSPTFKGTAWPGFNAGGLVASTTPPQSVLVASGTASGAPPPAAGGVVAGGGSNLVVGGGFEKGLVAPWGTGIYEPKPEVFWGSARATAMVVPGGGHAGKNALLITNHTSFAPNVYRTVSQQVAVTAGRQYCLSFWTQGIGGPAGILSMPLDKAWAHRVAVPPGSFAWTQFAGTATAEGSTFDVRLITENQGSILVDDIELTAGACALNGQVPGGANPRAHHQ